MIAEFVTFTHPDGTTRAEIVEGALAVLPRWRAEPDLFRKHFLVSQDNRQGAGLYFWHSLEAAREAHNAEWIAEKERQTGAAVTITYYDLVLMLDNETGSVVQPE
ncbi:MAG: hypothetical protein M0R28_00470 [Pigmentiphaga sp.]|nr:hypothetical protein [Pigmentiphaga sp.]